MISKIKDILRCYATGMGIKGISSAFEISRNTVRRYVHNSPCQAGMMPSVIQLSLMQYLTELYMQHTR